jgi:hypothetical protein
MNSPSVVQIVALLLGLSTSAVSAQTIRIKLVDGRNGRPFAERRLQIWIGNRSNPRSGSLIQSQTNQDGVTTLHLVREDAEIERHSQQLACGLSGAIDPTIKYDDTIGVRTSYVLCQRGGSNYSWLAMINFSTKELLQQGIATPNTCGKATASPEPGDLIIFVRPLTWWEKLKQ